MIKAVSRFAIGCGLIPIACGILRLYFLPVRVRWAEPIPVPAELDAATFEGIRLDIENRMRDNQDRDDRECGWRETLF